MRLVGPLILFLIFKKIETLIDTVEILQTPSLQTKTAKERSYGTA